jgi:hypothetical protein
MKCSDAVRCQKTSLPLVVAEHELQLLQDVHQFLYQTLVHMGLHSMHCDAQSDKKGKAKQTTKSVSSVHLIGTKK